MNGEKGKLTCKQSAALPHMAAAPSIEEGARNAGISKVTVYKWLKQSSFADALKSYRRTLEEDAFNYLRGRMLVAAKVYDGLLTCSDLTVKRLAAKDVLQLLQRTRDQEDLEERIAKLEAHFKRVYGRRR